MKRFVTSVIMFWFISAGVITAAAMSVDGESAELESTLSFTRPTEGTWLKTNGRWQYRTADGLVKGRWMCIGGADGKKDWYCFDTDGYMCTGWQKSGSGNWYYLRETADSRMGAMEHGFLLEPADGHTYYLDPVTGIMQTGWVNVDGKDYFFSPGGEDGTAWYWDRLLQKWTYSESGKRPCGSMYAGERTPDGRYADENGVCTYR